MSKHVFPYRSLIVSVPVFFFTISVFSENTSRASKNILLFFAIYIISQFVTLGRTLSYISLGGMAREINYAFFAFAAWIFCKNEKDRDKLKFLILGAALAAAVYGIIWAVLHPGHRLISFLGYTNSHAGFMLIALPLIFSLMLKKNSLFLHGAAFILFISLLLTRSKSCIPIFALQLIAMFLLWKNIMPKKVKITLLIFFLIIAAGSAGVLIQSAGMTKEWLLGEGTLSLRKPTNIMALKLSSEKWFLGFGYDNFAGIVKSSLPKHSWKGKVLSRIHNFYISIFFGGGIIQLALRLIVLYWIFRLSFFKNKLVHTQAEGMAIAAFALHGFFDMNYIIHVVGISAALIAGVIASRKTEKSSEPEIKIRGAYALPSAALCFFIVWGFYAIYFNAF